MIEKKEKQVDCLDGVYWIKEEKRQSKRITEVRASQVDRKRSILPLAG